MNRRHDRKNAQGVDVLGTFTTMRELFIKQFDAAKDSYKDMGDNALNVTLLALELHKRYQEAYKALLNVVPKSGDVSEDIQNAVKGAKGTDFSASIERFKRKIQTSFWDFTRQFISTKELVVEEKTRLYNELYSAVKEYFYDNKPDQYLDEQYQLAIKNPEKAAYDKMRHIPRSRTSEQLMADIASLPIGATKKPFIQEDKKKPQSPVSVEHYVDESLSYLSGYEEGEGKGFVEKKEGGKVEVKRPPLKEDVRSHHKRFSKNLSIETSFSDDERQSQREVKKPVTKRGTDYNERKESSTFVDNRRSTHERDTPRHEPQLTFGQGKKDLKEHTEYPHEHGHLGDVTFRKKGRSFSDESLNSILRVDRDPEFYSRPLSLLGRPETRQNVITSFKQCILEPLNTESDHFGSQSRTEGDVNSQAKQVNVNFHAAYERAVGRLFTGPLSEEKCMMFLDEITKHCKDYVDGMNQLFPESVWTSSALPMQVLRGVAGVVLYVFAVLKAAAPWKDRKAGQKEMADFQDTFFSEKPKSRAEQIVAAAKQQLGNVHEGIMSQVFRETLHEERTEEQSKRSRFKD